MKPPEYHGMTGTRLYNIWNSMKGRCGNPNNKSYKDYGGRGITVCEEWLISLLTFYNWAMSHGYSDDLTLERENPNGNYEPDNCCWIPKSEQQENCRNTVYVFAFGESKTLRKWSEDARCVVNYLTLRTRIRRGNVNSEQALTLPVGTQC